MKKKYSRKMVSIITVNYFSAEYIEGLTSTLPSKKKLKYEYIVVDNSANKEELRKLRKIKKIDKLIINSINLGFGTANNEGVKRAEGEYVFFLNPDTTLDESTLSVLQAELINNPEVAMVGCKILNSDGSLQRSAHRKFPDMWSHFWEYSPVIELVLSRLVPSYHPTLFSQDDHQNKITVKHLLGACIMMPINVFEEVGGFDEDIFLYREETDLAKRLYENGWQILYTPRAKLIHISGGSTQNRGRTSFNDIYTRSVYQYFGKYYGALYVQIAKLVAIFGLIFSLITMMPLHIIARLFSKPGYGKDLAGSLSSLVFHIKLLSKL